MFEWHDLNARHEATFFWLAVVVIVGIVKSAGVRRSVGHLVKTFLSPFISFSILGLLLAAAALSTATVILGRMVGLWETLPFVATTVWSFTTGIALLMNIEGFMKNDGEFRSKAIGILAPATITTEVLGNAIFPLCAELIAIPMLVVFTYGAYVQERQNEKKIYEWLLALYGLVLLARLVFGLINDPSSWESVAQSLIFPLIMTIGLFPYLRFLILFERCRFLSGVKSMKVTESEYGDDWPLTVAQAKLCCKHGAVWVEAKGKRYRINGWAEPLLQQHGVPIQELDPIWRDHPKRSEMVSRLGTNGESFVWKVDVGRLLKDGRALEETEK